MAYVSGFEFDLFVSYARADDAEPVGDHGGWVSQLVLNLERALKLRLGGTDKLKVYFDRRSLNSNHQLEELLSAVKKSAIFLAVTSRSYVKRDWTRRELGAFVDKAANLKCLFAAEYLPLDSGEHYPYPLQDHNRLRFWRVDEPFSDTPMPLMPAQDNLFRVRVHDLAEQMRHQIEDLNTTASTQTVIGQVADTVADRRRRAEKGVVLLAQVTDDLEEERDQIQKYLEQFGYLVLPEGAYPQGGEPFKEAVARDLSEADLFVQLLGPRSGRHPPDLPEGYVRVQLETARRETVPTLQWRRPDIDLSAIRDDGHRLLLMGETVIGIGLESFKTEVRGQLDKLRSTRSKQKQTPALVFINADQSDLAFARTIQNEFSKRNLTTAIPFFDGPATAVHEDLTENIVDCDVMVLLYGDASPLWVRRQLQLFNKLRPQRSAPPRALALYVGPPDGKPTDVGMTLPEMRRIDSPSAWSVELIQNLIEELQA